MDLTLGRMAQVWQNLDSDKLMAERCESLGYWRGNKMTLIGGVWYYEDGVKGSEDPNRRCGHCLLPNRQDGHDACLGQVEGLMNACCGHGDLGMRYAQTLDGRVFQKEAADEWTS